MNTEINLNTPQILLYSEFLLALPDEEYMPCIASAKVGMSLYQTVVDYAQLHYPNITIA